MKRTANTLCRTVLVLLLAALCLSPAALGGAEGNGITPRLVAFTRIDIPSGFHSLPEAVPADYSAGADLVIWEDTLAFAAVSGSTHGVRVLVQENGALRTQAEYLEETYVSGVIADQYGVAYMVGGPEYGQAIELVVVGTDGAATRIPLGLGELGREPAVGPLLRLSDGRLLVLDGERHITIVNADGSAPRRVSDIPAEQFVYHNQNIYFTNLSDLARYLDVYIEEDDATIDAAYPRLYRMRLDGTHVERLTDCGVRGLVSKGPYILYQNMDDLFVLPGSEEEDLLGTVWCYNAQTGALRTLGIDSPLYMPTPYGLAAWLPEITDEENCPGFALVLHDYQNGKPLYRLDAGSLYWYALPYFVTNDGIWVISHDYEEGVFEFFAIPLDGSDTNW